MCILFIHVEPKPRPNSYRLILANNRDEYYTRPAEVASLCPKTKIIAGKDLEPTREGGMWLGVSLKKTTESKCRIGALLNIPGEERKESDKFRGAIVKDFLEGESNTLDYLDYLHTTGEYRPHNFVTVELSENTSKVYHNCSIPSQGLNNFQGEQTLGFGNCTVEVPIKKVVKGKERFGKIVENYNDTESRDLLVNELTDLLKWDKQHLPDEEIKKRNPLAFENLSSIYVKVLQAGYGTRTHSIVLIDDQWNVDFIEITMEEPINQDSPKWNIRNIKAQL